MAKVDIFSEEWCNMVFVDKNKSYGAFDLRNYSTKGHMIALLISCVVFIGAISSPKYLENVIRRKKDSDQSVRMLEAINMEHPKEKQANEIQEIAKQQAQVLRNTIKFTPPVIKKDDEVKEENELKTQSEVIDTKAAIGSVNYDKGTDDYTAEMPVTDQQIVEEEGSDSKPFRIVEQQPEFPGGMSEMYKYMQRNTQYPPIARRNNISGRVFVQFVVGRDGKIKNVSVIKGVDASLDAEALRMISGMPDWIPGKQNGKAVAVYFVLPVTFILNN
jgi:protein TonB